MAVSISKGGKSAAAEEATKPSPVVKSKSTTPSWAKRGSAAQEEMKKYDKDATKHYEEKNRMWRFWLNKGEEDVAITFVDGDLLEDGTLDILTFREHMMKVNGEFVNLVCIAEEEPCPCCEGGDFPSLVGVLTCIDHRTFKGKKASYTNTRKLFVAKKGTIKLLQQYATKRGGLAGARFDVTRLGENDPNVGGSFDFEGKKSVADLRKELTRKDKQGKTYTAFEVADYEKELVHMTGKELRAMGFGTGKPIGSEADDTAPAGKGAGKHM